MFNSNNSDENEQSLLTSTTSPTVLDDNETSTLRSLPIDANMTIINDDKEGSLATRSVDAMPAGNLTLFNADDSNDDTVYRSLSISMQPTLFAEPQLQHNSTTLLGGKSGPTMEPYEMANTKFSRLQQKVPDTNNFKTDAMEVENDFTFESFSDNSKVSAAPDSLGAPVKPSFINYCGDHFDYNGTVEYFLEQMDQVSIECCCDLSYNKQTYEFEVLAYPTDQKILYAIQIYSEPKRNCHVIEFRRLDGPGFIYRNHIMSVWTALNKRNIGPGVSSNARPMMPTLNMESLDKDDDYKVKAATLSPMLKMVASKLLDVSRTGLQMLISATKATATQDALKETKAMTTVIDVALASENAEIDRCTGAVLREGVIMHHEEIKQRIIDLVIEKLTKTLSKDISLQKEIVEVQRNYIAVLFNLCQINNGAYHDTLREKGALIVVGKIIASTECKRLENNAKNVATLLKPF